MRVRSFGDYFDRHKLNPISGPHKGQQHLGLDFEVVAFQAQRRPCLEIDQPEAALRIRESLSGPPGNAAAHPPIDVAAQPGDRLRIVHAIADHQLRARPVGTPNKRRYILRLVLPIAIHGHGPLEPIFARRSQTQLERRTLAVVLPVSNHDGTRSLSLDVRVVGGSIIHNHDRRNTPPHLRDQARDGGPLVEAGDNDSTALWQDHSWRVAGGAAALKQKKREARPCPRRNNRLQPA
jgi:hypothetical protein